VSIGLIAGLSIVLSSIWLFAFTDPNVTLVVAYGSVLVVTYKGSPHAAAVNTISKRKYNFNTYRLNRNYTKVIPTLEK
jgi:hypothetical protein